MACACFEPTEPLPSSPWRSSFRPPLGRPYAGICRAESVPWHVPVGELLLQGCNLGYARAICDRVPPDAPDANRFCVDGSGAVRWAAERDHYPANHGTSTDGSPAGRGAVLDRQIAAVLRACGERDDPGSIAETKADSDA